MSAKERGPGQSKWEDGQRRHRRGHGTGSKRRHGRRDAALGGAETWAGAGMQRVREHREVRCGVPGRRQGRHRPCQPTPHGHALSRPLTLSPAPGRAGRRKRFSCGRHRCRFSGPRWSRTWPGPKTPPAAGLPTRRGHREEGGGRRPCSPGPAPRSTACVSVGPAPDTAPARFLVALPLSPAASLTRPALRSAAPLGTPPHGPAPCPSSLWLRPSQVAGIRLCLRNP